MLDVVIMVVSILLISIVLFQGNKATDAGQVITGGNDNLFQNMKERGFELFITRLTLVLGMMFFILSFISCILN